MNLYAHGPSSLRPLVFLPPSLLLALLGMGFTHRDRADKLQVGRVVEEGEVDVPLPSLPPSLLPSLPPLLKGVGGGREGGEGELLVDGGGKVGDDVIDYTRIV
jgi:hypothetical protein